MNDTLTRFQVYLDEQDVHAVTAVAKAVRISRSQIIRDATKAVALRYLEITQFAISKPKGPNPLRKLKGIGTVGHGSPSNLSLTVDDIYRT